MTTTWKARPTTYKGIPMRSRLEARMAAFLDNEGYRWLYEPRAYAGDGGQYLPDFEVVRDDGARSAHPAFLEVKPTDDYALRARARMEIVWESEPLATLLVASGEGLMFVAYGDPELAVQHEGEGREARVWYSFETEGWP